jgi:hypothetical protein
MKEYIKPISKTKLVEAEDIILAGSLNIGISDDPATGPAMGKEDNLPSEEVSIPSSVWEY